MNGYPTNSIEALNALNNGFASSSSSTSNGAEHFPPPNSAGFPMRQPSQSSQPPPMHPMAAQQNWMQQNHYPHPPAVQHSQYPAPWPSQMPPQGFHNGMPLPFIPQQVIHDAFALSHPVEPADEPVLVKALVESRSRGETYKEALNRLHGIADAFSTQKNGKEAIYRDIQDRIFSVFFVGDVRILSWPVQVKASKSATRPVESPPTEIIPHNRGGHKFTPADRAYFIKFIQWRLKGDPTLIRGELCELLAEKAPHHTAQSWASYWQSHHDLPDKILASIREGEEHDEAEDSEEEEPRPKKKKVAVQRKPKYKELSSSESELTESESEEQEEVKAEEEDDANDDDIEIPPFDESAMGPKGGPFTKGDLGVVVRHVASFTAAEFSDLSMQDKWGEIARRYPQRTFKSWGEYYRRNQKTIDKMAKKTRKINEAEREAQPAPPLPPCTTTYPAANMDAIAKQWDTWTAES
ncbi:hypothetical protein MVEN_01893600 [Mycena venus]|uniref:Uncharacterized protein n=1 Tax=Mycena venus TaxID=2733690 RepID=A0A8H6XER5_9AGAR|nr:hypothetical protein MVEN_01893600 [Mycena venus]